MVNPFAGSGIRVPLSLDGNFASWDITVSVSSILCCYTVTSLKIIMQSSFYFLNSSCVQGTEDSLAGLGPRSGKLQLPFILRLLGAGFAAHSLLHAVGQGFGAFVVCSNVTCFPISLMNGLCWRISDVQRMPVSAIWEKAGVRGGRFMACDWQNLPSIKL